VNVNCLFFMYFRFLFLISSPTTTAETPRFRFSLYTTVGILETTRKMEERLAKEEGHTSISEIIADHSRSNRTLTFGRACVFSFVYFAHFPLSVSLFSSRHSHSVSLFEASCRRRCLFAVGIPFIRKRLLVNSDDYYDNRNNRKARKGSAIRFSA